MLCAVRNGKITRINVNGHSRWLNNLSIFKITPKQITNCDLLANHKKLRGSFIYYFFSIINAWKTVGIPFDTHSLIIFTSPIMPPQQPH
jgi:hypothetical protein